MDTIISPARMQAAGLSKFLRLALPQAVRVAVVGFALCGLAAVVAASASDTVSYGELCSLLVASMTLAGFLFALVNGVRVIVTQDVVVFFLDHGFVFFVGHWFLYESVGA